MRSAMLLTGCCATEEAACRFCCRRRRAELARHAACGVSDGLSVPCSAAERGGGGWGGSRRGERRRKWACRAPGAAMAACQISGCVSGWQASNQGAPCDATAARKPRSIRPDQESLSTHPSWICVKQGGGWAQGLLPARNFPRHSARSLETGPAGCYPLFAFIRCQSKRQLLTPGRTSDKEMSASLCGPRLGSRVALRPRAHAASLRAPLLAPCRPRRLQVRALGGRVESAGLRDVGMAAGQSQGQAVAVRAHSSRGRAWPLPLPPPPPTHVHWLPARTAPPCRHCNTPCARLSAGLRCTARPLGHAGGEPQRQ